MQIKKMMVTKRLIASLLPDPHHRNHRRRNPRSPDTEADQDGRREGRHHHRPSNSTPPHTVICTQSRVVASGRRVTSDCVAGGRHQTGLLQDRQHGRHVGQHPGVQAVPAWQCGLRVALRRHVQRTQQHHLAHHRRRVRGRGHRRRQVRTLRAACEAFYHFF